MSVRAVAAVALATGLAVSGCTGDNPKPPPLGTPTASTSVTSTPSASPTPPELPAAANGTSAASAKAFVRYYVNTVNYATASGDVRTLRALDDGSCESCAGVAKRISQVYSGGGRIESTGWHITDMGDIVGSLRAPLIDAGLSLPPQRVVQKRDAQPVRYKGGRLPVTFRLVTVNGSWLVNEWERAA